MKPKVKVRVWAGRGKKPPARPAHPAPASSSKIQQRPKPQTGPQPNAKGPALLTAALLLGAIGLVGGGSWLALRLIINPASVQWLSALMPWGSSPVSSPQTWAEIMTEVSQTGQALGSPLYFSTYPGLTRQQAGFYDLLLPVVRPLKHCPRTNQTSGQIPSPAAGPVSSSVSGPVSNSVSSPASSPVSSPAASPASSPAASPSEPPGCSQITELRVYRPKAGLTYDLLDRISVTGPEELFVVAPLARSSATTQGTSRTLPFTEVSFVAARGMTTSAKVSQSVEAKARPGIWLQLSGQWQRGSRVLYGQLVQYDPNRSRLFPFQDWSSPLGEFPTWQQVTGDPELELVVNQSVGLEPQFQVFQLKPSRSIGQSISLEAITLTETASNHRTYLDGLLLARNGLWSPALALLQSVKPQLTKTGHWSASAQAQLDLIRLHAQVTQAQANRDWASPTQQILAAATDGRWAQALEVLKQAHRSGYDVRNLLTTNSDRLWQRIGTALRVNAKPSELQTWGTLLLTVRQTRQQALLWLQKQPNAIQHLPAIQQTLAVLEAPDPPPAMPAATPQLAAAASIEPSAAPSALLGAVTPLTRLQPQDWSTATQSVALTLPPAESWYQVTLLTSDRNAQVNRLATGSTQLQLVVWQGANLVQTIPLTVKAVQGDDAQAGSRLLASGASLAPNPRTALVAVSTDITWLQPTASLSLNELSQRPVWQSTLLPQLWQQLQTAQLVDPAADPLQTIGSWTVQALELTGDQSPELMLTIQPPDLDAQSGPLHTLIFSNQALLYSDLTSPQQSLIAIAGQANALPSLLVQQGQDLQLWQWSRQAQKFEQQ